MKRFIEEFEQRKREVNLYFEFLGSRIDREIAFREHDEIERILKANRGGSKLLTVKTQRNLLAHGNISFSECGRERTFIELNDIKNEVINYLEDILNNIEIYIDNKDYKKTYSC